MSANNDHPQVRIHPPVLTFLHLMAAFLLGWLLPLPVQLPGAGRALGILLVFGGLTLAFSAVRQFARSHTTLDPHGSPSSLVTDGPYRFSRNPIYLGFVFTLIGFPLAFGGLWGLFLSPVLTLLFNQLVIHPEEAYLQVKFGNEYARFRANVRRWL